MKCKIGKITLGKDNRVYVRIILPDVGNHQPYSRGVTGCYPKEAMSALIKQKEEEGRDRIHEHRSKG